MRQTDRSAGKAAPLMNVVAAALLPTTFMSPWIAADCTSSWLLRMAGWAAAPARSRLGLGRAASTTLPPPRPIAVAIAALARTMNTLIACWGTRAKSAMLLRWSGGTRRMGRSLWSTSGYL